MASRPSRAEHDAAVARRLRLLGDELAVVRGETPSPGEGGGQVPDTHTRVAASRPPGPEPEPAPVVPAPGRHASRRPARTDWLPETLQGRVALGSGGVAVVAVLVAVGLGVTAWWVVRSDSTTVTPAPAPATAEPTAPVSALATPTAPTADSTESVTVDVAGKVRRPGIAVLDVGARVIDALRSAGGVRRGVDLTSLNLARVLVDGEQVVVGVPAPAAAALPTSPGAPGGTLVNLNTADQADLEALPEVGPVTAQAILAWRDENGGFTSTSELLEVDGIGEATLDTLAPLVTV